MPEKRHKRGCGGSCVRCWKNNMIHNNPTATKFVISHPDSTFDITGDRKEKTRAEWLASKQKKADARREHKQQ